MDPPQLTEDEMAAIKKEALERLRPFLCDKITADRHFDYLRSKKILTRDDAEEISSKPTNRKRTGELLDFIAENPRGLDTLIESIQYTRSSDFLITKITDEVQRLKNEKIESLKAAGSCRYTANRYPGATNDLSRTFSSDCNYEKASTLPYPTEGDWGSMNVTYQSPQEGSMAGSTLPRPGDPGAPPLPEELQSEPEGACGGSPVGDMNFQPLRSRSSISPLCQAPPAGSR